MKGSYSYTKYHAGVNLNHPGFRTRPPHDVFPQDIQCVYEGQNSKGAIYIGNLQAAQNLETLKKLKIQSILTACKNVHLKHPKTHVPYSLYIPGEDHENYDLSMHFDTAIDFIHQSRKETNILVHCMAGISRSVTLVLAYLIKHKGMSFQQSFKLVQRKRKKINPNPGFIRQLQKWEQKHALQRSRSRQSSDLTESKAKARYESAYMSRPYSYKDTENTDPFAGKYKLGDYTKYANLKSLQSSQYRNYNPEYNPQFYKMNSFNTTLNPSIPRNNSDNRLKEVLNQMNTTHKNSSFTFVPRERSIQHLSKELDDKISKIKQKYYEVPYPSYDSKVSSFEYCKKRGVSDYSDKKINNYITEDLGRSRADRQSLRNSIYAPYNATRAVTFQYA